MSRPEGESGETPRRAPRAGVIAGVCVGALVLLIAALVLRPGGSARGGETGAPPQVSGPASILAPPANAPRPQVTVPPGAPPHLAGNAPPKTPGPAAPAPAPAPKVNPADLPPDHPPITADEGTQVSIQWLGHACFYIYSPAGVTVVTDPFDPAATGLPAPSTGAHLVTISSDAPAHNDAAVVHSFPDESGKPVPKQVIQGTEVREKDVHILPIATVGGATRTNRNYAYVIEAGPLRIAHLGALARPLDAAQVRGFGPIDILLVPAGGEGLTPKQAAETVKQLNPRIAIPMTYAAPEMSGPDAKLRSISDFVAACPFAVDRKEYDVMMFSRASLPPSTEVWTLQYRR